MSSDVLSLAALGQPFSLGMLYDARRSCALPGSVLWPDETVRAQTEEIPQPFTDLHVTTSDSSESKMTRLDVEASLKAGFLSGLVEVSGSAKYLNDRKKFQNQSRVTFQYSVTTKVKQLSMIHLSSLDPQQLHAVQQGGATHLVTKILYGAEAFFVFDSGKLESSSVQQVEGRMEAVINKIPSFTLEGKVEIHLNEEEKNLVQTFSCKFHGDFVLTSHPATFVDAVKTFAELPTLLGASGERTVPVKVWMMPLVNLDPQLPKVLRDLSPGLLRRVEEVLEDLKQMEIRCNDSLVDAAVQNFPQIQQNLQRFQNLCGFYTSVLQQVLETKLPSVRQGVEDETLLKEVLDRRDASPFSQDRLTTWIQNKEREINVVWSCLQILDRVKTVHTQSQLDRQILDPGVNQALCFVFTSLESSDPCLDQMAQFLDSVPLLKGEDVPWYYSDQVLTQMRDKARTFCDLFNKYSSKPTIRFLVAAVQNPKHVGASISFFKDGVLQTDDFSGSDLPPASRDITEGTVGSAGTPSEGNMAAAILRLFSPLQS